MRGSIKNPLRSSYARGCLCGVVAIGMVVTVMYFAVSEMDWRFLARCFCGPEDPPPRCRGVIRDRRGRLLAQGRWHISVYANPRQVADRAATVRVLSDVLRLSETELEKKLSRDKEFIWIERRISEYEYSELRDRNLAGIGFIQEAGRNYPYGRAAAPLLGLTDVDNRGIAGLERDYDRQLVGSPGQVQERLNPLGQVPLLRRAARLRHQPGADVKLTIDAEIQQIAEEALNNAVFTTKARAATVIVMNPNTGEVLAMASWSASDSTSEGAPFASYRNHAVTDSFEPGGSLEPFLLAAALEDGISPETMINCERGAWHSGFSVIHDPHSYGPLALSQVLKFSSNIGAAKLALQIGPVRYQKYLGRFGFGQKTAIDLSGEVSGKIPTPESNQLPEGVFVVQAFGQAVAVTPIQLLTGFNAVVNGGRLMQPYIISRITTATGQALEVKTPFLVRRVMSQANSRRATEILVGVTQPDGTGAAAATPGFQVAGKTGTAQKVVGPLFVYSPTAVIVSFVGAVPAENPVISVLVVLDEPQCGGEKCWAASTAAPVFQRIASRTMGYLRSKSR